MCPTSKQVSEPDSGQTAAAPQDMLLPRDTKRSLPIMLLRAREAVMSGFRPVLARHGLSEQQWRVMRVLAEAPRMDSREVATLACVLAPSLTRIIRILEGRGLLLRERHRDDARRINLSLTPAGSALIATMAGEGRTAYNHLRARYGAERVESLLDLLGALADLKP